jgi:hypothetical protein
MNGNCSLNISYVFFLVIKTFVTRQREIEMTRNGNMFDQFQVKSTKCEDLFFYFVLVILEKKLREVHILQINT